MPKKKAENLYRSYEDIISELPDGTIYPCVDDPNYGKMTKKGKIIGCVKGDGYWVGGASVNREDVELISDTEIVRVSQIPQIEQDLISPDLQTVESRLADIESDPDIARMIKQSGKTPSNYQRAIYHEVKSGSGNVVIEARAGSGKTTTLVNALKLIPKNKRVLVSAFNVKIAAELRARCPSNVDVMTLHGFGLRQLKKYLKEKGQIDDDGYDEVDDGSEERSEKGTNTELIIDANGNYIKDYISRHLADNLKPNVKLRDTDPLKKFLLSCLNLAQAYAIRPEENDFIDKMRIFITSRIIEDQKEKDSLDKALKLTTIKEVVFDNQQAKDAGLNYGIVDYGVIMTKLLLKYALSFKKKGVKKQRIDGRYVDVPVEAMIYSFNDMIYITAVSEKMNIDQYDYVFIDEAQDMNIAQVKMLIKAGNHARIFVIGDPRQAIYLFQYSELDMMQRMEEILKAKKLYLSVSYRVPKAVAELARNCVSDFEVPETAIQGEVNQITGTEMVQIIKPGDIIISRKNAVLKHVANLLVSVGTPIILLGLDNYDKLLERIIINATVGAKQGIDITDVLQQKKDSLEKEIQDYDDGLSYKSVGRMEDALIKHGANRKEIDNKAKLGGDRHYKAIMAMVYAQKGAAENKLDEIEMVERLAYSIQAKTPLEIIERARELIGNFPRVDPYELRRANPMEVRKLVERFEREKERAMKKYILLTTVHKFKGSEADRVFVLEDTFSSNCSGEYNPETAEEDNLYYVAVTRAKKQLFMVSGDFKVEENEESDPM